MMRITVLFLLLAWARAFRPSAFRPSVRGGRLFAERSDDELIIPSSVGAALVGMTTGGLLDGALANGDAPWSPILGAVVGAGGAFYVASEVNGKPSELVKGLIGKPTAALGVSIKLYFVNKATEIKEAILAVPGNVQKAVQKKIDETVADIKAIPTNTQIAAQKAVDDAQKAAVKRVEDTIADIKAIPSNTQKAIFQRAEDLTEAAKKQVEKTTAEIVSFPERTVSEVQKSVERTTKSIEKELSAVGLLDSPSASSSKPKPKPSAPTVPAKPSTTAKSAAPEGLIDFGSLFGGASEPAPAPAKPSTSTASPKASAAPAAKVPATKSPSASSSSSSAAPEVMFDFGGLFGGSKASPAPAPKPKSPPSKSADPASKAAPALPPKAPAPKGTTPSGGFFGLGASKPSVPASVKPAPTPAPPKAQAQAVTAEAKKADDAVNKRQQQEAAMKRFAELEAVKKASAAKPKPAPAAPAPKAAAPAPVPAPLAKSKSLSQNAVKVLTNTGAQPAAISRVDEAADKYLAGSIGPEGLYQAVKAAVGNSSAFSVFPDVVGSLPRGERKSKLNEWFQSQAN